MPERGFLTINQQVASHLRAQRLPQPGASVRPFLDELAAQGLEPGTFNLPDREEDIDSFHGCLEALFQHTPPTALMVDEAGNTNASSW